MSMKIYNGIKFRSKNIVEIVEQLNSLKEQALKNSKEYAMTHSEDLYYFILNNFSELGIDLSGGNGYETKMYDILNALQADFNSEHRRRINPDFICSVVVIPWTDGNYYGIIYADDIQSNIDLIHTIADDFYYQNQTDPDENVSENEWSERRDVWNEIFDKYFYPRDAGLVYELVTASDYDYFFLIDVIKEFFNTHRLQPNTAIKINSKVFKEKKLKCDDIINFFESQDIHCEDFHWQGNERFILKSDNSEFENIVKSFLEEHSDFSFENENECFSKKWIKK